MGIKVPFDKMAETAHNVAVQVLEERGVRSLKPPGLDELMVPYAELSGHTRAAEADLMMAAVERARDEGFVLVTRGFVVATALLLGMDIGLLLILLRLAL